MPSIVLAPGQPFDLDLTLSCGQVFGWVREGNAWRGVVGRDLVRIAKRGDRLSFSGADPLSIRHYFGLDLDLPEILASIDRDPVIHRAITHCSGLRIVRQPAWECLASFICATYSSIPGIEKRVSLLRRHLGDPLSTGPPGSCSFPSPAAIMGAEESLLSECSLGYRARYLSETARLIVNDPGWEERIAALPYREARVGTA